TSSGESNDGIFPRTRASTRRYQRSKVVAILITFGIGWIVLKLAPIDAERIVKRLIAPPPGPAEHFESRESEVATQTRAVIGRATSAGWEARSLDGHPFVLIRESGAPGAAPAPGDTVLVRGIYTWDPAGGRILVNGSGTTD
ncbi:MAG: hypothetical protein HKN12_05810, partial [Gemmatimonadetes bacterium]|nr:hypothetical protein [Gemmatimonadota bacterium]